MWRGREAQYLGGIFSGTCGGLSCRIGSYSLLMREQAGVQGFRSRVSAATDTTRRPAGVD